MLEAGSQPIPGHRLTRARRGASGEVWEAHNDEGSRVALKFINCRTSSSSLISSEIRVLHGLSELRHPQIIQMFGVHATANHMVISMERADGNLDDLRQVYLEETGKNIPADHLLDLLDQAAAALDFLAELKLPGVNPSRAACSTATSSRAIFC